MIFVSVRSFSPFRITLTTDVSPDLTVSDYVLTRSDNASSNATINYVFATDSRTVELALGGDGLIDGIIYTLSNPSQPGSPSAVVAYRTPLIQNQTPIAPADDPEAEAFGIDIDWLSTALTAAGDTPTIRGRQCLVNDLALIAVVNRGELFHRPESGAGLNLNVNGPMTNRQVSLVIGSITKEWSKDARVQRNGVTTRVDVSGSTGRLTVYGTVLPVAIDEPLLVKLPGGGT